MSRAIRRFCRKVYPQICADFWTEIFPPRKIRLNTSVRAFLFRWEENWVLKSVESVDVSVRDR
jgi:hypothetical protein